MRNTQIKKALNRKMCPQYLGPLIVITRNFGGAYVLCKLNSSVLHALSQHLDSFLTSHINRFHYPQTSSTSTKSVSMNSRQPPKSTMIRMNKSLTPKLIHKNFLYFLTFYQHLPLPILLPFSVLYKSRYRFSMVVQTQRGFFGHDDLLSLSLNFVFRLIHIPHFTISILISYFAIDRTPNSLLFTYFAALE
jgi:hypothetical protein